MDKPRLFVKLVGMVVLWAIVWFFLHGEVYQPFLDGQFSASTAFILGIVISFISLGAFMTAFVYFLFKKEDGKDFRSFFRIEYLDIKGIWLALGLGIIIQIINIGFLWKLLLEPVRNFLISIGITGSKIGVGSGEIVPLLSPLAAAFLTGFLLLFWWIEIPEELFFRGYIQNRLQDVTGKNTAMCLSALIWDVAHLWGLVNVLERFLSGLIQLALPFRLRQNTTPSMIIHSVGNRSLLLAFVIPQIWSTTLTDVQVWLFILFLDIILIIAVIAGWKVLKLDRK